MPAEVVKGFDYYLAAAHSNLLVMSRTAREGTIDVSVTGTNITALCQETLASLTETQLNSLKRDQKISALDLNSLKRLSQHEIKKIVAINFKNALLHAFELAQSQQPFSQASEVREFIEVITKILGKGIINPEKWLRQHDSEKPPYTEARKLNEALDDFCQQFLQRIRLLTTVRGVRTAFADTTAAWVEYRLNLTDHPIADGCGKTAAIVSTFVYMLIGQPIPIFLSREHYFNKKVLPRVRRTENASDQDLQFAVWSQYYCNELVTNSTINLVQEIEKSRANEEIEVVFMGEIEVPLEFDPENVIYMQKKRIESEHGERRVKKTSDESEIEVGDSGKTPEEELRKAFAEKYEKSVPEMIEMLKRSNEIAKRENGQREQLMEKLQALTSMLASLNREVTHEMEEIDQLFQERERAFLQTRQIEEQNLRAMTQIVNYLSGMSELKDLDLMKQVCLSRESALAHLKCIKLFDLEMSQQLSRRSLLRTTYSLRACLLEKCTELTSAEAFTITLDITEMNSLLHLRKPSSWVPERRALHAKALANQAILAIALSKGIKDMMGPATPFRLMLRGNTAAGKTTWLRLLFQRLLDESGNLKGSLNVDDLKYFFKDRTIALLHLYPEVILGFSNAQVHLEGKAIFSSFQYDICKQIDYCIIDGRFETVAQLREHVNEAKKRKATIKMIDLDVPLSTSIERVRLRTPYGRDPLVSLDVIEAGFIINKKERLSIILYVIAESTITEYYLIHQNEEGDRNLVAIKQDADFKIVSELFIKCIL